jgi:hypothetical protein
MQWAFPEEKPTAHRCFPLIYLEAVTVTGTIWVWVDFPAVAVILSE